MNQNFIRNVHVGDLLETFLVTAVSSILFIRFYLAVTHYPQIGHGSFHIAHMLWGGLLLIIANILLLSFLGNKILRISAIIGGIGFGTFIDELGKFITSDNNYFFQPTVAILYSILLLVFFIFRYIERHQPLSDKEYLMNALQLFEEAVNNDMDREEKKKLLLFLRNAHSSTPIATELRAIVQSLDVIPDESPGLVKIISVKVQSVFLKIINAPFYAPRCDFFTLSCRYS